MENPTGAVRAIKAVECDSTKAKRVSEAYVFLSDEADRRMRVAAIETRDTLQEVMGGKRLDEDDYGELEELAECVEGLCHVEVIREAIFG